MKKLVIFAGEIVLLLYRNCVKIKSLYIKLMCVVAMLAVGSAVGRAQIYDGISQSDRFRVWGGVSQPYKGGEASFSTYFGYKQDIAGWFDVSALARYNFSSKSFVPAIWLNFNSAKKYYLLTRSIYDFRQKRYIQSLAATVRLPKRIMVDATWDNLYNGRKWCVGDRLQAVAGMNISRIRTIFNIGYSFLAHKGVVGTVRYKFNNSLWTQLKVDGGVETADLSVAYNFN